MRDKDTIDKRKKEIECWIETRQCPVGYMNDEQIIMYKSWVGALEWVLSCSERSIQEQIDELRRSVKELRHELHMHERGWQHENG